MRLPPAYGVSCWSGAVIQRLRGKREPGATPGLPRSGEWKRKPSSSTGRESGTRRPVGAWVEERELAPHHVHESEDLPATAHTVRGESWPRGRVTRHAQHHAAPLAGLRWLRRRPLLASAAPNRSRGESS